MKGDRVHRINTLHSVLFNPTNGKLKNQKNGSEGKN